MDCQRLQGLVKTWYLQVQDESMAPARMVSFMEKHIGECPVCLADPLVRQDISKITAIILPAAKTRKMDDEEEEIDDEPEEDISLEDDSPDDEVDDKEEDSGKAPLEDDDEIDEEEEEEDDL
jgi:hypothetical protein